MPEEMRLWATIVPRIDLTSLKDAIRQGFQESISVSLQGAGASSGGGGSGAGAGVGAGANGTVSGVFVATNATTSTELARDLAQTRYEMYQTSGQAYDINRNTRYANAEADEVIGELEEEEEADRSKQTRYLQATARYSGELAGAGMFLLKGTFGILEDIHKRMKSASPLLQTIESLIQLAVTLFFMPLGNKLAEVMLPAVLDLVDAVVDMWDSFEGQTLGEMFEHALDYGVDLFADYFRDLGSLLEDQGGILGAIGSLMTWVGDFLDNNAQGLLEGILNVMEWVLDNIKTVISLIVAFYTMQYASNIAMMAVTASSGSIAGWFGLGGAVAAGAIAGLGTFAGLTFLGLAEGGHVDARPGGTPAIIGEGGEGEWVIPDSKMGSVGTTNNYYTFNGFTSDDVIRLIRDEVSSQVSLSRLKGGF